MLSIGLQSYKHFYNLHPLNEKSYRMILSSETSINSDFSNFLFEQENFSCLKLLINHAKMKLRFSIQL